MTTSKARQYYVSEETRKTLSDIGGGNYSKGIRISAAYHDRLVDMLNAMVDHVASHNVEGGPSPAACALLTEIEEAGK